MFENFISSVEESNPKLLPPNAFPGLTMPKMHWRPGFSAPIPAEGAYSASPNFLA